MADLRSGLLTRRELLLVQLAALDAASRIAGDEGDVARAIVDHDQVADRRASIRREVRAIQHALTHVDAGTYGKCEDCGDAISPKRLQALPYVVTCVDCQADRERVMPDEQGVAERAPRRTFGRLQDE